MQEPTLTVSEAAAELRARREAEAARCVAAAVSVEAAGDAADLIDRAIDLAANVARSPP